MYYNFVDYPVINNVINNRLLHLLWGKTSFKPQKKHEFFNMSLIQRTFIYNGIQYMDLNWFWFNNRQHAFELELPM